MMDRVYSFFRLGHYEHKQVPWNDVVFIHNNSVFIPYNLKITMNDTSLSTIVFSAVLSIHYLCANYI